MMRVVSENTWLLVWDAIEEAGCGDPERIALATNKVLRILNLNPPKGYS